MEENLQRTRTNLHTISISISHKINDARRWNYTSLFVWINQFYFIIFITKSMFNWWRSKYILIFDLCIFQFHCLFRKRSLSDSPHDDLDNTRDSLLSDQSQCFSDASNEPELMIIDFEYCAYNYRGFDLANHFIEWTIDYTNKDYPFFFHKRDQYPTKEQQVNFN